MSHAHQAPAAARRLGRPDRGRRVVGDEAAGADASRATLGGIMALVGALALYAVATLMRGERWAQILRRSDVKDATRADAYALVPVGYMGNNVLPARGGELLRTFLLGGRVDRDEAHDPRHDPRRARARRGRARRDPRRARLRPAAQTAEAERDAAARRRARSPSLLALARRDRVPALPRAARLRAARARADGGAEPAAAEPLRARAARRLAADLVRRGERLHRRRPRGRHHAQPAGRRSPSSPSRTRPR